VSAHPPGKGLLAFRGGRLDLRGEEGVCFVEQEQQANVWMLRQSLRQSALQMLDRVASVEAVLDVEQFTDRAQDRARNSLLGLHAGDGAEHDAEVVARRQGLQIRVALDEPK